MPPPKPRWLSYASWHAHPEAGLDLVATMSVLSVAAGLSSVIQSPWILKAMWDSKGQKRAVREGLCNY